MIRLTMSVEGETEVDFVKMVLAPHLHSKGVEPIPILPHGRGGNIRVDRVASAMAELFWNFDYVTSLVDFYGFVDKDNDAPCQLERRIDNAVGQRIQSSWDETRVFASCNCTNSKPCYSPMSIVSVPFLTTCPMERWRGCWKSVNTSVLQRTSTTTAQLRPANG